MTEVGDDLFTKNVIPRNGVRWQNARIVGETKKCWVLDNGHQPNKKTLITAADRLGYRERYYTKAGMEGKEFCDRYARDISCAVSVCDDADKLRTIAELIGKDLSHDTI